MNDLWDNAKNLPIQVGGQITGGFDIGFDDEISEETRETLMRCKRLITVYLASDGQI